MIPKRLITVALATMLLIGGVAAVGAASPVDRAAEEATDAHDGTVPDETDRNNEANETDRQNDRGESAEDAGERGDNAESVGPSDGLPEQVPGHVSEIHETIDSFLGGSIDDLGESLSDRSSDEKADDGAADGSDEASENSETTASQPY